MVDFAKALMCRPNTPVEDHREAFGLLVKREDLSCPPPGPAFSKARGVYAHLKERPEKVIGVLDTYHSQAGHAVARACSLLGKECINFYPEFKHEPGPRRPQHDAYRLGAKLIGIPAGRSSILYHQAKKLLAGSDSDSYMMPNALKLRETVRETSAEVMRLPEDFEIDTVIIPASSGTIAAGVISGFLNLFEGVNEPRFVVHMGYTRPEGAVRQYISEQVTGVDGDQGLSFAFVDEGYAYKDKARAGATPPWPCNPYYDLKAFRWWLSLKDGERADFGRTLFWNIG